MRDQELAMEAMSYVDPALVEQAERCAPAGRRRRWLPVPMAACVGLLLMGTAAVGLMAGGYQQVRLSFGVEDVVPHSGEKRVYDGYELIGGEVGYLPLASLSQQSIDLARQYPQQSIPRRFDSMEQAQEFYGVQLPQNPKLDRYAQSGCSTWMHTSSEGPTVIQLTQRGGSFDETPGAFVTVEATVRTECMDYEEVPKRGRAFPEGTEIAQEGYAAEGVSALLFRVQEPPGAADEEGKAYHIAHLVVEGVEYTIEVSAVLGADEARKEIESIVRGFAKQTCPACGQEALARHQRYGPWTSEQLGRCVRGHADCRGDRLDSRTVEVWDVCYDCGYPAHGAWTPSAVQSSVFCPAAGTMSPYEVEAMGAVP